MDFSKIIPADKLGHMKAGAAAAAFGAGAWFLVSTTGLIPLAGVPAAAALASIVAGVTKEGADKLDNDAAAAAGLPPVHGVEVADAVATAAPGLAAAVALHLLLPALQSAIGG